MESTRTVQRWHEFANRRDPALLDDLLADEATFHSPVVHSPQRGKRITRQYLVAALHVLGNESFRYVREIVGERDAALEFVVEVEGITVNGVDLIRWDETGRIVDFKVMIRPLKAIDLVREKMAAMLNASG